MAGIDGKGRCEHLPYLAAKQTLDQAILGSGGFGFAPPVPALYLGNPAAGSMFAYVPGMVNMQDWNGHFWLPRPFGPRINGVDVFEDAVRNVLGATNVNFIDNWDTYHRLFGEVHCGTNVIREPAIEYR